MNKVYLDKHLELAFPSLLQNTSAMIKNKILVSIFYCLIIDM